MEQDENKKKRQKKGAKCTSSSSHVVSRRAHTNYSLKQKLEALKLLQRNNFNLSKTAREIRISTCCLRRWRNDHPEVFSNTSVQIKNIQQSIEIDLIQRDKNFIQKNYAKWEQVCEKLTDQLLNMAETEADIEKIARTLKIIREIMNPTNSNNLTTNVATSQINVLRLELEKQSLLPEQC